MIPPVTSPGAPSVTPPVNAPVPRPPIVAQPVTPAGSAAPAPGAETAIFTRWLEDDTASPAVGFDRDETAPVQHLAPERRWPMVLAIEVLVVLAVLVGVVLVALRRG